MSLSEDAAFARRLAREAGDILLKLRAESGLEGRALGDAGDADANAWLIHELKKHRPEDAILSEESRDTKERLSCERVWIIDPLDGTREYSEGRDDWAVHVGLSVGGKAAAGAVAIPGRGEVWDSEGAANLVQAPAVPRMVVSRTRAPEIAAKAAEAIGAKLLPMGSAGAKTMALLRGDAEIYLHAGGQYEWDNCAPVAVAAAHGLHCSRIDGSPLVYNREDPLLPDLLVCRAEYAEKVLSAI